jgi:short subunit dehydrogenase-like uncharacterized protein
MVLVFGATGFSGRMVVERLAERGVAVLAAARSAEKLARLAERHPGIATAVADVEDPASLARAAARSELLVTTVGPYTRFGAVAAEAALAAGIGYVDITGEPAWLRRVFDEFGPRAAALGLAMLPAFGYDYVPGNLAAAIALERSGREAVRVDVGYFLRGRNPRSTEAFSRGTLDSLEASAGAPRHGFRDGVLVDEQGARRVLEFELDGATATAVAIGASEQFALPRLAPWLREVNVGLGWFPPDGAQEPVEDPGSEGPGAEQRDAARTNVVAVARDADGAVLAGVQVEGPNPYDLSGLLTAWAAERILAGDLTATGALGPVEAFGLERLRAGCASVGLTAG